jgi:hypothetical protein
MVENSNESFLTPDDYKSVGEKITQRDLEIVNGHPIGFGEKAEFCFRYGSKKSIKDSDSKSKKEKNGLSEGQITLDEIIRNQEKSTRSNLPGDEIIGKTPTGLPRYRSDNPGEMYQFIEIEKIPRVDSDKLNRDSLAYIKTKSLELIKERFHIDMENTELVKRLVVFKKHTLVFSDDCYPICLGGDDLIAIEDKNMDESELPFETKSFTYLANLTNDAKGLERKHTTIRDGDVKHPINLPIRRHFFAKYRDAIETKISIKDKNGFGQKRK